MSAMIGAYANSETLSKRLLHGLPVSMINVYDNYYLELDEWLNIGYMIPIPRKVKYIPDDYIVVTDNAGNVNVYLWNDY